MAYTELIYHIVFSTQGRVPWLKVEQLTECCRYVGGIVRDLKGTLLDANGAEDHLHLVAHVPPTISISDFLRETKAGSSKWIHRTYPAIGDFAWQESHAAFTVSKSALPDVLKYVRNQQEHHRKMSFQEELIALLQRHGVEYDLRYVMGQNGCRPFGAQTKHGPDTGGFVPQTAAGLHPRLHSWQPFGPRTTTVATQAWTTPSVMRHPRPRG